MIVNVTQWHGLEFWLSGHSRSLKVAPVDKSYTTSYQSSMVTTVLFCIIFELFDVE